MAIIQRPSMHCVLNVPVAGSPQERARQVTSDVECVRLPVRASAAEIERNSHVHCDELHVTLDWLKVGLDVRLVRNATVELYVGNASDLGEWHPDRRQLRFCGVVVQPERHSGEGKPHETTLKCYDYTDFFLRAKPFGSKGIPDYSQTLDDAWRRIVSQTPGAGILADRLLWAGRDASPERVRQLKDTLNGKRLSFDNAPFPKLSDSVSKRFEKLGKVPTKPETDAWAVWMQTVGMCGLISYIDRDYCVLTTHTNYYTEGNNSPVFTWGDNVTSLSESLEPISRKGVICVGFDALLGRTVEGRFHPDGTPQHPHTRRAKATKRGDTAEALKENDWVVFAIPGITTSEMLTTLAQRIHAERSRQELVGTLGTGNFLTKTVNGDDFEVLDLGSGDDITVRWNENTRDKLLELPDLWARIDYLLKAGYPGDVALILAKNVESLAFFKPIFYVRRVAIRVELDDDTGGDFDIEVTYCNKLETDGKPIV